MEKIEFVEAKKLLKATLKAEAHEHVVKGSVRRVAEGDLGVKTHGFVCLIKCSCGQERLVNTQDAFQTKMCLVCKKEAEKEKLCEKRAIKSEIRKTERSEKDREKMVEALAELQRQIEAQRVAA